MYRENNELQPANAHKHSLTHIGMLTATQTQIKKQKRAFFILKNHNFKQ